jgi:hypothetical protein
MNTEVLTVRNGIKEHSCYQVKVRKAHPSHEYVVPSNFATIPTNNIQKRIMNNNNRRRISFPPSIKEENEDEDFFVESQTAAADEEEDIPLAVLAYRKGFVVPDRIENVFPLIQHIPQSKYVPSRHHSLRDPCSHRPSSSSNYNHNQYNNRYHCDNLVNPLGQSLQPHQQFYQLNMNNSYSSSSNSYISASSSETNNSTRRAHSSKKGRESSGFFRRQSLHF